ncbi:MAG TPA: GIY-YIG nuclease family protein [Longimicrobium sp.]|nr:GIY-YIG nuclease family protein [Longimicrobium sp.]
MRVIDLISLLTPEVVPAKAKVHLATWTGEDDPFDLYLHGKFDEWQGWQRKRNFERPYVISLISLRTANHWLFAGVYEVRGSTWHEGPRLHRYELVELPSCSELNGRLIARFERPGRQSYLNAENWADQIQLASILPERARIAEFPGFKAVNLAKHELDSIVRQGVESWKTALSSVGGVYLISDTETGRLYVGSATGEGGIWQRWVQYASTGHGGNQELLRMVREAGLDRVSSFRFSILEIADTHTSPTEVRRRESHWKSVLLTRQHGHNRN